jgi:hypothetical protein
MHAEQALGDDSSLGGFEHRTFTCSVCGDVERRLILKSRAVRTDADPVLFRAAPPMSPPAAIGNEGTAAPAFVQRLFAKLDGIRDLIRRRKASPFPSDSANPQERAHPAEHVPEAPLEPIPEITPASLDQIRSETVPAVAPVSMPAQTDKNKDECEVLLKSAIEMVQSAARSSQKKAPLTELSSAALTSAPVLVQTSPVSADETSAAVIHTKSISAERKSPVIVVQVHHDAQKAKYVAKDIKSGLGVIRHEDRARLREMCDRLGWQIVDEEKR